MSATDPTELREVLEAYAPHARSRPIRFMERHEAPALDAGVEWPADTDAAYCVLRRTTVDSRSVQRVAAVHRRQLDAARWVLADREEGAAAVDVVVLVWSFTVLLLGPLAVVLLAEGGLQPEAVGIPLVVVLYLRAIADAHAIITGEAP